MTWLNYLPKYLRRALLNPQKMTVMLMVLMSTILALSPLFSVVVYAQQEPDRPNANYAPQISVDTLGGVKVNTWNGNLFYPMQLFGIPSRGISIELALSYNSSWFGTEKTTGYGWQLNYGMFYDVKDNGDVVIVWADGRSQTFTYSAGLYYSPQDTFETLVEYEAGKFELKTKHGMLYLFEDSSHQKLTKMQEPNGNYLQFGYNGDANLSSVADTAGRSVALGYTDGKLTTITDANASPTRTFQISYNGSSQLTQITDPKSNNVYYEYSAENLLTKVTDQRGYVTNITYNQDGIATNINHTSGQSTYLAFDKVNHVTSVIKASSNNEHMLTEYTYDAEGRINVIKKLKNGLGDMSEESFVWDAQNNLLQYTDPLSHSTHYTYDSSGNILTITDAGGHTTTYSYEPNYQKVASVTDARNNQTQYQYDGQGNLVKIIDPAANEVNLAYDTNGDLLSVTDAGNNATTYQYNNHGYQTHVINPLQKATVTAYDNVGRKLSVTDPNQNTVSFEYDANGNQTKVIDALSHDTVTSYDQANNPTAVTDANQHTVTNIYDSYGRVYRQMDALGNATTYNYDLRGNLQSVTDAAGGLTSYEYDYLNRLVKQVNPDSTFKSFTYDEAGNLVSETDESGNVTTYTYDVLNQVTDIDYPGPESDVHYEYDAVGNVVQEYTLSSTINRTFDNLNRVTLVEFVTAAGTKTVESHYNELGQRYEMVDSDAGVTQYNYDDAGQLTSIINPSGMATTYAYDDAGRLTIKANGNGTYDEYVYDNANRLTSISHKRSDNTTLSAYEYTYDNVGNRLSMTVDGTEVTSYGYDDANQLTSADYPGTEFDTFTYDVVGNRQSLVDETGTTNYTYNSTNELLSAAGITYTYDNTGNLKTKTNGSDVTTYSYNGLNKLSQIVFGDSSTEEFKYFSDGRLRSSKDRSGTEKYYVYDGANVLAELDATGNTVSRYTSGSIDDWLVQESGGNSYYYHSDGLGSVVGVTDIDEILENSYSYDAFGAITGSTENVTNPYTYTGRRTDSDSGLYNYRARFYDPSTGRFTQQDPAGMVDGVNMYVYVVNNPVNAVDPMGLKYYDLTETQDILNRAANEIGSKRWAPSKYLQALEFHSEKGSLDFLVNEKQSTFQVPGIATPLKSDEFGNYIAGYTTAQLRFGYSLTRLGGDVIALRHSKRLDDDGSVVCINQGAADYLGMGIEGQLGCGTIRGYSNPPRSRNSNLRYSREYRGGTNNRSLVPIASAYGGEGTSWGSDPTSSLGSAIGSAAGDYANFGLVIGEQVYWVTTDPGGGGTIVEGPPAGAWFVERFNDKNLNVYGYSYWHDNDNIDETWATGEENSSRRYTKENVFFGATADWRFHIQGNDGMRIYVDGQHIGGEWWDGSHDVSFVRGLAEGEHDIVVEYFNGADDGRIKVWWEPDYGEGVSLLTSTSGGTVVTFPVSSRFVTDQGFPNDAAQYINVPDGWIATVYKHADYQGERYQVSGPSYNHSLNGKLPPEESDGNPYSTSSIQVRRTNPTRYTLYEMGNFGGEAFRSDRSIPNLQWWGQSSPNNDYNDWAQSIIVENGYEVVGCTDADYKGDCGRGDGSHGTAGPGRYPDLGELVTGLRDNISSVRVCEGSCPAGPTKPHQVIPSNGSVFHTGDSVQMYWFGNGSEYFVELWGGAIGDYSNAVRLGWTNLTYWTQNLQPSDNAYQWKVRSWNGFGTNWSDTWEFYVQDVAIDSVSVTGPDTGLLGESYQFSAEISPPDATGPISYTWSPEPTSGQGTNQVTMQMNQPGTQQISVTVTNPRGSTIGTHNIEIGCGTGEYIAEYYDNMGLSGTPVLRQCETNIDHDWGTGGPNFLNGPDLTVTSGQTYYSDDVRTRIVNLANAGESSICVADASQFSALDEILIVQMTGTAAGNYEYARVVGKSGCNLTLSQGLEHGYETTGVPQVLKVPHFNNVTVDAGGVITARAWDGTTGGIVAFKASGQVINNGTITANYLGFRGGESFRDNDVVCGTNYDDAVTGQSGETYLGQNGWIHTCAGQSPSAAGSPLAGGGAGGAGQRGPDSAAGAAGGSYGERGGDGEIRNQSVGGIAGTPYGDVNLNQIFLGSGGGGGGRAKDAPIETYGNGGDAGGIILIEADTITLNSHQALNSNGETGHASQHNSGGGGGGAGGSIKLTANIIENIENIVAVGGGGGWDSGNPSAGPGGGGGYGRIVAEYCDSYTGSTTQPLNLIQADCSGNEFSVRWTNTLDVSQGNYYTFATQAEDGARVILDQSTIIDDWAEGYSENSVNQTVDIGTHDLTVEFFANAGNASIVFSVQEMPSVCPNVTEIPTAECEALEVLYDATGGAGWTDSTGWRQNTTPCSWEGITCTDGHVTSLVLEDNNLSGHLPAELAALTSLTSFDVYRNHLTGDMPAYIGTFANLTMLALGENDFTPGEIPASYMGLTLLESLYLHSSNRTGTIPTNIDNLSNLQILYLQSNQLQGQLPESIGALQSLSVLWLRNNQLGGQIPVSLSTMGSVLLLDLGGNMLETVDPTVLAYLADKDPDWYLTQTIPPTGITVSDISETGATISWEAIPYSNGTGYYEVALSQSANGPYDLASCTTSSKVETSCVVEAPLQYGLMYYAVVRTFSAANPPYQVNDLLSEYSNPNVFMLNVAPTGVTLLYNAIEENQPVGSMVGPFDTYDDNHGDSHTYSLVSGEGDADNFRFTISNDMLYTAEVFDQEATPSFSIRVRSTDQGGLWAEDSLVVGVIDVNESPADISLSENTLLEDLPAGTVIGVLTSSDPDQGDEVTYSFASGDGDTDNAKFVIEGDRLKSTEAFDYESANSFSIRVRTTDQGGLWYEDSFTVSVIDVNETPIITDIPDQTVDEDTSFTSFDLDDYVNDPDVGDTILWTYAGSNDLTVDIGTDNVVTVAMAANWNGVETITFRATDAGGLWAEDGAVFTVNAVNDQPQITSSPVLDAVIGTLYQYDVEATDVDAGTTLVYSLIQSPAGMSIDNASGLISWTPTTSQLGDQTVQVRASDGALWDDQTYTVTVHYPSELIEDFYDLSQWVYSVSNGFRVWLHEGQLRISSNNTTNSKQKLKVLYLEPEIGATYDMQMLAKVINADKPKVKVLAFSSNYTNLGRIGILRGNAGTVGWTTYNSSFTVPQFVNGQQVKYLKIVLQAGDKRDNSGVKSKTYFEHLYITKQAAPIPVLFTGAPTTEVVVGDTFSYQVAVTTDLSILGYTIDGPEGMTISDAGVVTWEPKIADIGIHEVTVGLRTAIEGDPIVVNPDELLEAREYQLWFDLEVVGADGTRGVLVDLDE